MGLGQRRIELQGPQCRSTRDRHVVDGRFVIDTQKKMGLSEVHPPRTEVGTKSVAFLKCRIASRKARGESVRVKASPRRFSSYAAGLFVWGPSGDCPLSLPVSKESACRVSCRISA